MGQYIWRDILVYLISLYDTDSNIPTIRKWRNKHRLMLINFAFLVGMMMSLTSKYIIKIIGAG